MDNDIATLYAQGLTLRQIGKRVGLAPSTVGYRLSAQGIETRTTRARLQMAREDVESLLRRAAQEGLTQEQAAEVGGLRNARSLRHLISRYGLVWGG